MSTGKETADRAQDRAALEDAIAKVDRQVKELKSFNTAGVRERWDDRVVRLQKRINATLGEVLGMGTPAYKQHTVSALDSSLDSTFGQRYTADELKDSLAQGIKNATTKLESAKKILRQRLEDLATAPTVEPEPTPMAASTPTPTPCLLYTSPSPRDRQKSRMPSSA